MRISNKWRSLFYELWPKIRSFKSRQPKHAGRSLRIGPSQHLEVQISDDLIERYRRVRSKLLRAVASSLFTAKANKIDRSARPFACGEDTRQFQHSDATRC